MSSDKYVKNCSGQRTPTPTIHLSFERVEIAIDVAHRKLATYEILLELRVINVKLKRAAIIFREPIVTGPMLDSYSTSLAMVPKGNIKKLHKISTKSFSASANKTLFVHLFTKSFNDTCTSA
ncbi:unnamed protein product [Sphenostylis stenocarpa]|uniref:Uncharacterized protein n=1 Tax=Sphenostylis stenocarpa TaxID=92480 RepID=A0AA86T5K0_9FABA|nr:unnamed protein product [Sphenostylis stenocarpa]